jgi:thiol-disulfide isomerase/thioredoxin
MALTESTMLSLGSPAPDFSLTDTNGSPVTKSVFENQPLLVMFLCNHCPYVKHVAPAVAELAKDYADSGIGIVAIQSNDVDAYPDDGPEQMKQEILDRDYVFPYCLDANQAVAKAYTAACTPDFFLFDSDHKLAYRGRIDETRPTRIRSGVYDSSGNEPDGKDLRNAIDAVLNGNSPTEQQYPSLGCNIKWKPGNEPDYFSPS